MVRSDRELREEFLSGDALLTPVEVATLMGVGAKQVTRWASEDLFPDSPDGSPAVIRTLGRQIRIRASVVRGLLNGSLTRKETLSDVDTQQDSSA